MIGHFIDVIRQATGGEPAPHKIEPGKLIRFPTSDKRGDESGWCKLFPDGEGGVFGCWRQGINETWQARQPNNQDERQAFAEKVKQAREEAAKIEAERRAECRAWCAAIWAKASPAKNDHPYLIRKQVKAHGLKVFKESLIVQVQDLDGTIHGLQFISPDGAKKFKTGTDKAGHYAKIGKSKDKTVIICEGWATGASIHQATGHAVVVAFDAGNLLAVARNIRSRCPGFKIIIAADDDDHATGGNPGLTKATEAARAVGGLLAVPVFPETRGPKDTDFNDQARMAGPDAVSSCLEAAIIVDPAPSPAPCVKIKTEGPPEQWPEPLPLPDGLPSVNPLDSTMIPLPLRGWLMDIADRMQIPPDFSTAAAIVALGSIIGRGCGIRPKRHDDWLVIPNLWGGVIGRPSLMKTPAITEAQRHLVRLETEARVEYEAAAQAQEINHEIGKIRRTAICEEIKKAAKKGNNAAIEQARVKLAELGHDDPATRRRYQTQDGTTEKIGELLNQNPRGILVNRDELIGWFRTLDKSGREGDRAFYLEAWNGTRGYTYDRIGRGTLDVDALCISIFGAITPGPLSDYAYQANRGGNGDDGLLQRFQVMVWPDTPTEWKNVDRFPDTTEKNRAWEIFRALAGDIPGTVVEDGSEIPALRFSPEGQEVFDAWRSDLESRLRSDHGLPLSLESHLAKYRSLMPALALVFHLVGVADGSTAAGPVSERAALMAAAWCQYLESHAGRVYGGAKAPGMEAAREIVKHIRQGDIQSGCKPKDIYRNQWSRLATPEEVKSGLEILAEYEWLTIEKVTHGEKGGRPSEVVTLSPHIKNFRI